MKKNKFVALGLALLLGLSACGQGTDSQDSAAPGATESELTAVEPSESNAGGSEEAEGDLVTEITEPVEITFWHAMNDAQEDSLKKLTEGFMAENPNITVTLQNQGNYGDLSQKITTTLQSPKNLPTMTQAYPDWLVPAMESDLVTDLTPYVNAADPKLAFDNWDDVLKGLRDGVTMDGKIMGIPFNKSTEVFWYNKDIFEELNLEVPTTFEELKEVSQKITETKGIPAVGWDSLSNFYTTYLNSKGVTFDENLDVTGEESTEAAQYYMDGIKGGYFRIAGTDKYMSGPFGSEQVAAYIGSNAGESYISEGAAGKFEYAAAPYPTESPVQQGTDLYVFETATPEQKTAAFLYMKYLTGKESQITWALESGYLPIRTSAVEDPAYANSDSAIAPILADATRNLFSKPVKPGSQTAYNDSGAMLEGLLASPDNDVQKALEEFKPTFESAWQ